MENIKIEKQPRYYLHYIGISNKQKKHYWKIYLITKNEINKSLYKK